MGFRQLYLSGARVGRAHIASVINTLILAYAGASLPVLLLIAISNQPVGQILTNQFVAQEIVRSAVGVMGLLSAVPITTALAAAVIKDKHQERAAGPARRPVRRPVRRPARRLSRLVPPPPASWDGDDPDPVAALASRRRPPLS
jgi:hypothetical protein